MVPEPYPLDSQLCRTSKCGWSRTLKKKTTFFFNFLKINFLLFKCCVNVSKDILEITIPTPTTDNNWRIAVASQYNRGNSGDQHKSVLYIYSQHKSETKFWYFFKTHMALMPNSSSGSALLHISHGFDSNPSFPVWSVHVPPAPAWVPPRLFQLPPKTGQVNWGL